MEKVFHFLKGEWAVDRLFRGSYVGSFVGRACLAAGKDSVIEYHYHEKGQLTDAEGRSFQARQEYRYQSAGDLIRVLKRAESEWELMHELEFIIKDGFALAEHKHLCGMDCYEVTYRVDFSGILQIGYVVTGPTKEYCIDSVFSRLLLTKKDSG